MPLYHDDYDGPNDVEIGLEVYVPPADRGSREYMEFRQGVASHEDPRLTPEERAAAQQIARNTGQPVQVVDVKAEEKFDGGRYSGDVTPAKRQAYGERVAGGHSPAEADYSIWLNRGREKLAAEIREQQTKRQLRTGMPEKEGGQ